MAQSPRLAARCPVCHTTFRVVADQLKLRGGLVRCGKCDTVFDGRDHLLTLPSTSPHAVPGPENASGPRPSVTPPQAPAEATADIVDLLQSSVAETPPADVPADEDDAAQHSARAGHIDGDDRAVTEDGDTLAADAPAT